MYIVIAILAHDRFGRLSYVPLAVGFLSLLGLPLALRYVASTAAGTLVPVQVKNLDSEVLPYLAGYVIPFLDVDFADDRKLWAMIILFLTLALVHIAAQLVHVNPLLTLLGWHVYSIDDESGAQHILITRKRRVLRRESIEVVTVANHDIHWSKGR